MQPHQVQSVELSALRQSELLPLLNALDTLDLSGFTHISIHAPSRFEPGWEAVAFESLSRQLIREWPIVVHPDAVSDWTPWRDFGSLLCIENMDRRKPIGRTALELEQVFHHVPEASFCFDIGHARQCDPTMTEAYLILREFGSKLRQVHVSEVNTRSRHDPLSYASILAFQEVAHLIPNSVPLILETLLESGHMADEIAAVRRALPAVPRSIVA